MFEEDFGEFVLLVEFLAKKEEVFELVDVSLQFCSGQDTESDGIGHFEEEREVVFESE